MVLSMACFGVNIVAVSPFVGVNIKFCLGGSVYNREICLLLILVIFVIIFPF